MELEASSPSQTKLHRQLWIWLTAILTLSLTVQFFSNSETWWNLAGGKLILNSGLPHQEPFSFLPGAVAWHGEQWLFQILLASIYKLSPTALAMLFGIVGSLSFALVGLVAKADTKLKMPLFGLSILLSALASAQFMGAVPTTITMLGIAITYLVLEKWRYGNNKALLALPIIFLFWANLSASFVFGPLMVIIYLFVTALLLYKKSSQAPTGSWQALGGCFLISVLATLINPAGLELYTFASNSLSNPTSVNFITNLAAPNFHEFLAKIFELEFLLVIICWFVSKNLNPYRVTLVAITLVLAFYSQAMIPFFALVAIPELVIHGSATWSELVKLLSRVQPKFATYLDSGRYTASTKKRFVLSTTITGLVILGSLYFSVLPTLSSSQINNFNNHHYPQTVATYALSHLPGQRIYATYDDGGYLANTFGTKRMVYLYSSPATFSVSLLNQYLDVHDVQSNWLSVLAKNKINYAILDYTSDEAVALQTAGWRTICYDSTSQYLLLTNSNTTDYANAYANKDVSTPPSLAMNCG